MHFSKITAVARREDGRCLVTLACGHVFDASPLLEAAYEKTKARGGGVQCLRDHPAEPDPASEEAS